MTKSYLLLPIILGIFSVLQAGMNEKILPSLGITGTVLLNSVVLIVTSGIIWSVARYFMQASPSDVLQPTASEGFQWWYLVPGIFGYFLVAGLPVAIQKIGANSTFLVLVITQICIGLLWECVNDDRLPSRDELIGCTLAISAVFFTKKGLS